MIATIAQLRMVKMLCHSRSRLWNITSWGTRVIGVLTVASNDCCVREVERFWPQRIGRQTTRVRCSAWAQRDRQSAHTALADVACRMRGSAV